MVIAAILAGGVGKRMGDIDKPKQFLEIGGKPILVHTTEQFVRHNRIDHVVVLCPEEWIEYTRQVFRSCPGLIDIPVISGGPERNDTIMNAIGYIEREFGLDQDTVIVTHDAVRPFVTADMIDRNLDASGTADAVDTVMPATDTIVVSADGTHIIEVPDRKTLYQGQTPQTFRAAAFREIYGTLTGEEKAILTDAIKAFVLKGRNVVIVRGSTTNIKVTYKSDIEYAETILESISRE